MTVVIATELSFRTFVGSGWSFEARREMPGKPAMVQAWLEVFLNARSAAMWPAPWLFGTTRQVPEGISAVVHAPFVACVEAGADVEGGGDADAEDAGVVDADVDVGPEAPSGFAPEPDSDVDVLATDVEVPDVDAPPALFDVLPEHPAVSAAVPSAPRVNKREIRFMEPNLPG